MAVTCFRFLGFRSLDEVDQLTFPEVDMLMEAARLIQVDRQYCAHLQAFANQIAKQTKGPGKNPKPKYARFEDFFDYEKEQEKAQGKRKKRADRFAGLKQHLRRGGNESG